MVSHINGWNGISPAVDAAWKIYGDMQLLLVIIPVPGAAEDGPPVISLSFRPAYIDKEVVELGQSKE